MTQVEIYSANSERFESDAPPKQFSDCEIARSSDMRCDVLSWVCNTSKFCSIMTYPT